MTTTAPVTRSITLTRVYNAPRDTVFAMWTEAEHLKRWWGPDDCTIPHVESDPRPGGRLIITMTGPGFTHTMQASYREIDPPASLVVECAVEGPDGTRFLETSHSVQFEDLGDRTRVTVEATATALQDEALGALAGMNAGWNQSLQCLDDMIGDALDRQIVLTRMYSASPEKVFPLWLEQEHLEKWWIPAGFRMTVQEFDPRPGGRWILTMHGPDGTDYPTVITYNEIVPDERLVSTHGDSEDERPSFTSIVTFDEMAGMTALAMRGVFESPAARDRAVEQYGAVEGGQQMLERLATLLGE